MSILFANLLADVFPLIVPAAALAGLIAVRTATIGHWRAAGESIFWGTFMTVAIGAMRSMSYSDPMWLVHTMSLGFMLIGATKITIAAEARPIAE